MEAGDIPAPTRDDSGRTIYRTGRLATPLKFFAYLVADRPGAYTERDADDDGRRRIRAAHDPGLGGRCGLGEAGR